MVKVLDDDVAEGGAGDALPGVRDGVEVDDDDGGTALECCTWDFVAGGEATDGT
jgi:hypothetical protein